jgi:hypothetical protein
MSLENEEKEAVACSIGKDEDAFIFMSYSRSDKAVVYPEVERLRGLGYHVWYDEGIRPSSEWTEEVAAKLAGCSLFLVFLSPQAIASRNVLNEIHFALEKSKPFLAIHLTELTLPDSLQLQVGRIQAVLRHRMNEGQYREQLGRWLSESLSRSTPASRPSPASAPTVCISPADSPAREIVRVPSFHYGSVVPPDYFIGREDELEEASRLIQAGQGWLLVGNRRAGKTSFCKKLIHEIMGSPGNEVLATYLNLQQCRLLTIETFLEHTLLNLIGEMARQVFHCKYSDLLRPNPFEGNERLRKDKDFADFFELFARVKERTHAHHGATPSPLLASEFVQLSQDLLEILRAKRWRCCVIFYDEANRLPHELSVELLASNEETLNTAGLISVYAASPEMAKSFNDLSDVLGHHLHLGPFRSPEDLRRLLSRYCRRLDDQQAEPPTDLAAVDLIWKLSLGLPYIIQLLSGLSFRFARDQHSPVVLAHHVEHAYEQLRREKTHLF